MEINDKNNPIIDDWQIIATKRVWTYPLIIFYIVFGLLLLFSSILELVLDKDDLKLRSAVIILIIGVVVSIGTSFMLINKIRTPKALILYNKKQQLLRISKPNKQINIIISEIEFAWSYTRSAWIQIVFKKEFRFKNKKRAVTVLGVSKQERVAKAINGIIDSLITKENY